MHKASSKKSRKLPNPKIIQAVQSFILGAGNVTQEQAMLQAGYAKTTAKKQCQLITQHPLYREYLLAKATEVTVTKDFLNLKYLIILARPNLKISDEFKALDCLATINGYKPKEGADASPVNIWQLLIGGDGNLTDEKTLKERIDLLNKGCGRSDNRFKVA